MISKELLSEVLNKPVTLLRVVEDGTDYLASIVYTEHGKMNIYELAHKCKDWALMHDFSIKSTYDFTHTCFASVYGLQRGSYFNVQADAEPEAIFKACQWILDNKDSK
jgi:hypothetical protein